MLIDFEGIDGSGKTTLSNRLAKRLREEGRAVTHLRDGGRLGSRISGLIRDFTRDSRNLELSDRAELLLYCAREVQLNDELLGPALGRGDIVIADRSIYSHLALACAGRGLPEEAARAVASFTAGGRWPDLVFLVDVEPAVARARKRVRKIHEAMEADEEDPTGGSRKGLAGEGLALRVRDALLALAGRDPARWVVVDNTAASLEALEQQIHERVRAVLDAKRPAAGPPDPSLLAVSAEPRPAPVRARSRRARPASDEAELHRRFHEALASFADREPGIAVSFAGGLETPEVEAIRERLSFTAPDVVAWSLAGLEGEAAWKLRRTLARRVPRAVAHSLGGLRDPLDARAVALREELAEAAPKQVVRSLKGVPGPVAAELRERLAKAAPMAALESTAGLDDEHSWAMREALGGRGSMQPALLESVAGLASDRAWEIRRRLGASEPLALLASIRELASDEAWAIRERWLERATKPVLRSLARLEEPRAWRLRERLLWRAPEALENIGGLDGERAWHLREAGTLLWPAKAVRSLGAASRTPRGASLLWGVVSRHPEDFAVVRAAVLALHAPAREVAPELPVTAAAPDRAAPRLEATP